MTHVKDTKCMKVTIVANGEAPEDARLQAARANSAYFIAVDGGANTLQDAGVVPDVIIGDLDSVDTQTLQWLKHCEVEILCDLDQDVTDLELACKLATKRGATHIDILGGLGGRFDHMFANIMTLFQIPVSVPCVLEDSAHRFQLLRESCNLTAKVGQTVSVLPLIPTTGLNYTGLRYDTKLKDQGCIAPGWLGVCNVAIQDKISIQFQKGAVLVIQCN